jgi:hypothetical protein
MCNELPTTTSAIISWEKKREIAMEAAKQAWSPFLMCTSESDFTLAEPKMFASGILWQINLKASSQIRTRREYRGYPSEDNKKLDSSSGEWTYSPTTCLTWVYRLIYYYIIIFSSINLAVLVQEFGLLFINLLGHLVDFPFERTK